MSDLDAERSTLRAIVDAHERHVAQARRLAERLAADAAAATEEGIRDLVDEDAEADAAIAAAMVRQLSAQVMHAAKRVRELEQRGDALAFGHTTSDEDERWYIGRQSVIDGDDVLLVDWRADLAVPFYRATPGHRMGVTRRRHFHYADSSAADSSAADSSSSDSDQGSNQLEDYSDELLGSADTCADESLSLRGEAALMAALAEPSAGQMRSVVATIQAEQDEIIRASSKRPLIVQGGPGAGKTVVALHRAAYLLYNDRTELADTGVLLIGPSPQFLGYIKRVLPSLGETGVVAVTPGELFPGVRRGAAESPSVAQLKGDIRMARFLEVAVDDRQRPPKVDLDVWYGSTKVTVKAERLKRFFELAQRSNAHNTGAKVFSDLVIEQLRNEVYHPSFDNHRDAEESFRGSSVVREFLLSHWPTLTPTQFLNDLFGSKALLTMAACKAGVEVDEALGLFVARTFEADLEDRRWSTADVPLLDEAFSLLIGSVGEDTEDVRVAERDAASEFDRARRQDDGVDLAEFVHDEELDGFAVVDQSQLGLSSSDYEEAEEERMKELAPEVKPHPKFQQRLAQQSDVDHG